MKILLAQKIHDNATKLLIDNGFDILISESPDEKTVKKYIADVDAIIIRSTTKLSRETIFCGKKLKVIGRTGSGVDNIDVKAASDKNIPICNAPEANIITVAEHTVGMILSLAKNYKIMDYAVREHNWKIRYDYKTADIFGKILGVVGFGKIGIATARMCLEAFKMKIIVYDLIMPKVLDSNFPYELKDSMEDVFSQADFVTLHMPYTGNNYHIIGEKLLRKMKRGSYLINTSRGGIVDEIALAKILSEDLISGAAIDVFEDEPPGKNNPLLKNNNAILTPHSAGLTKESSERMAVHAVEGVIDVLQNKKPKWIFNIDEISLKLSDI